MTTAADDSAVEDAFEALLAGRPVPEEAAGLAAFTEAVRETATSPGRPNAALAELLATGLLTDQSSPSTRTARSAGAPPSRASRNRIRRRFAVFFPALFAKLLSAGAVAQAATGAGRRGRRLHRRRRGRRPPGPVQDTFTSIVSDETEETPGRGTIPPTTVPGDGAPVGEVPAAEEPAWRTSRAPTCRSTTATAWTDEAEWATDGPIAVSSVRRVGQLRQRHARRLGATASSSAPLVSGEPTART